MTTVRDRGKGLWWLAAGCVALGLASSISAEECLEVVLPSDQNHVEVRERIDLVEALEAQHGRYGDEPWPDHPAVDRCVLFINQPPDDTHHAEVGIIAVHQMLETHPAIIRLAVDEHPSGHVYREVILHLREAYNIRLTIHQEAGPPAPGLGVVYRDVEMIYVLQRNPNRCSMSAQVRGDFSGRFWGDVAYYNFYQYGVKEGMSVGSMGDRDSQESMSEFIDGMEDMIAMVQDMGFEVPGIEEANDERAARRAQGRPTGSDEFDVFIQEQMTADDGEGSVNFGLNLSDVKLEGGRFDNLAAMMGGGFTLTVSGNVRPAPHGNGFTLDASTVTATVGLGDEGSSIPFVLDENGANNTMLIDHGGQFYTGMLDLGLRTENRYTIPGVVENEPISIHVGSYFYARQGAFGCMN